MTPPPRAEFQPGQGAWRLEFGPLLGFYDFDPLTRFEDAPLFGARLSAGRSRWFRIEGEFTEVYTNREITHHSARQMTVALHGRLRWPHRRWDPSLLLGLAFVGLDDSEDIDSFGEAWDLGVGLGYRLGAHWTLRGEWLLRSQRFSVFDPNLSPDRQDNDTVGTWARSWLIGAHYAFSPPRGVGSNAAAARSNAATAGSVAEKPPGHALHVGFHAGNWDFNDAFRFENEVLYGLSAGAWIVPGFSLELDLQRVDTRSKRDGEDAQLTFVNLHGRYRWRPEHLFAPGLVVGVSFMTADNQFSANSITEGFDLGPSLQWQLGRRVRMIADLLFRYTSVRVAVDPADGRTSPGTTIEYVWSRGGRLGVDFAF